jgi:predicted dehydrogenase
MDSKESAVFRVGIVGAGAIVQQFHIPVLRSLDSVGISWVFDRDEATVQKVARVNQIPLGISRGDLSSLPAVDVVLLAVPWGARRSYYEQIREMPRRPCLYVEKPFARSLREHREHLAGFANWQVAIGHARRIGAPIQFARHIVASGALGAPRKCEVVFGGLGRILTHGGYYGDLALAGGGILMEMGTHYLDAAFEAINARSLKLGSRRLVDHAGCDVHVEGEFEAKTDTAQDISVVCKFTYLEQVVSQCVITFEHATLSFEIDRPASFEIIGRDGRSLPFSIDRTFGPQSLHAMFAVFWQMFLESIATETAGAANASEMTLVSRAVGLLYGEET